MSIYSPGKYFSTSNNKKNKNKAIPFVYPGSVKSCINLIITKLKGMGLSDFKINEIYGDIFTEYDGYEISFELIKNEAQVIVNMSVFSNDRYFKTKKLFNQLYSEFNELFIPKKATNL